MKLLSILLLSTVIVKRERVLKDFNFKYNSKSDFNR